MVVSLKFHKLHSILNSREQGQLLLEYLFISYKTTAKFPERKSFKIADIPGNIFCRMQKYTYVNIVYFSPRCFYV